MFQLMEDNIMDRLKNYLVITWEIKKAAIMSEMEYRANFLMQVFFMMLNNATWIFLWGIFFTQFPEINGWKFRDTIIIFALSSTSYGLMMFFAGGAPDISRMVARGELDRFFFYPKDILWQISINRTVISAIGDIFFGAILFFFAGNVTAEAFLFFILFSFISALIFFNFVVLFQSVTFFVGNFEDAAENFFWSLLGLGFYPQTVFHGLLQIIMFTVLPAFFVFALPSELIFAFNMKGFGIMLGFWITTFILANIFFRLGLKRYESGNMMNINM
jgi:ABC-2 type transport system permease protein